MTQLYKYPRTQHIEGSRRQPGDEDTESVPFSRIRNRPIVVEEKMDGANSAISFSKGDELLLQSRGHYLTGGYRERHFNLLKTWANAHADELRQALGDRYIMYGEWLYAKHTIYYDELPHYFMEFDVFDKLEGQFLDTSRRMALLRPFPVIVSVNVLHQGVIGSLGLLHGLVSESHYISTGHLDQLRAECLKRNLNAGQVLSQTDRSRRMEGVYIKVEEDGIVKERYKYVRADFLSTVINSQSHWLDRPIIPNKLKAGIELFVPPEPV